MVADLRYFNSLEHEVDTLKSQLETQKTQFLNEIDRLSREYYYADHMNAILGVYTDLDEVTNLQCDYLETLEKSLYKWSETLDTDNQQAVPVSTLTEPQHNVNHSLQHPLVEKILLHRRTLGAQAHEPGNLKLRTNFVEKFLEHAFSEVFMLHRELKGNDLAHRDGENLDKMKEKGDACIFVGYSTQLKAYRVFNKRTRMIVETIHVNFDELPLMASDPSSVLTPVHNVQQRTRRQLETYGEMCMFALTVSQTEPKNIKEAMADSAWIESIQEELHQFDRLDVWELVDRPLCKNVINLKWLWKNKRDEEKTVIRNKSVLVAKMALKQHFFTGPLKEEVNVKPTRMIVDPYHPDKVYRLKKALYGLKQAPRAWYDELSNFLVSNGFSKGILIHQSPRGIFINQAKYAQEILKKHSMTSCDSIGTPMATKHLDADLSGTPVNQTKYRNMVGALMYLTVSRPDIFHATCYCACYQAKPTKKHLTAVKRIFWYLKDSNNMGLWYPKDTGFELTAFSDSDHAGCLDSCKSTSSGIQFIGGDKLVSWSSKKKDCTSMSSAEVEYVSLSACCAQVLWLRTIVEVILLK
ncbi:retrovirus-related pol polyprotein from transposon TNT 1-94 [Tanacetum coccineum]